jgi:mRNA-degrading endonuclease RelE of RelBE toxin-antitoxin system
MTDAPSIQILVTPDFQGQLRKLAKRYRNIRSDLQPLFDDLESGNCPGDQIFGTTYTVFKVRVKNSDIQKGKRFKKAKVQAIESFTNCETTSAFCLSRSIPNPMKLLSQLVKFAKLSIASMNPPKPLPQEINVSKCKSLNWNLR